MRMDSLTGETMENWVQFLITTFCYTDEQLNALAGDIDMTQEIFEGCLESCVIAHDIKEFYRVWERFPKMADAYLAKAEEKV